MKELNFLKHVFKRKVKVTQALLILFLITGGVSYGKQVNENIVDTTVTITETEFENKGTINTKNENATNGDTPTIINSGLILGYASLPKETIDETANGIVSNSYSGSIGSIINSGLISGYASLSGGSTIATSLTIPYASIHKDVNTSKTANGIALFSGGESIANSGIILGASTLSGGNVDATAIAYHTSVFADVSASTTANGIVSFSEIGSVANRGIISGAFTLSGGSATATVDTSININANAAPSANATAYRSANGVFSESYDSNIRDIINHGLISGYASLSGGSAIATRVTTAYTSINEYVNVAVNASGVANGIASSDSSIGDITNHGLISGYASLSGGSTIATAYTNTNINQVVDASGVANGIASPEPDGIGDIRNSGVISGYLYLKPTEINGKSNSVSSIFSGNGIANGALSSNLNLSNPIVNNGVIKGSTSAIAAGSITGRVTNNGILAGREIFSNGREAHKFELSYPEKTEKTLGQIFPATKTNNGIYVRLESEISEKNGGGATGNVKVDDKGNPIIKEIVIETGGKVTLEDGSEKLVLNGSINGEITTSSSPLIENKDIYLLSSKLTNTSGLIINGTGIEKGALVIDNETTLTDSIVNGYNTGVYLEEGKFVATNTVINGGGLKNDVAVLKGSNNNVVKFLGNSIINGKIDLGAGDDNFSIASTVQVNGDLNGGEGNDTLNLGETTSAKENSNLNILHNISGFENINTNGSITLFETTKISGANNINLESGNLILRVNPTEVDSNGKITGHALYKNSGTISSNGGNLVIGLNGTGKDSIISMTDANGNSTVISDDMDSVYENKDALKTNSLVLDAIKLENGDIKIDVVNYLTTLNMDSLRYEKLNKIYQSIVGVEEIGKLANTTLLEGKTKRESLGELLIILNQMYANTPYSYSLKSTRDSLKLFSDNMSYLTIKPQVKEYIAQGKIINTGVKNDSSNSGKNYYGFDIGTNSYETTTSTTGAIGSIEYGLSNKTSVGIVIGGNNQDVKFKGKSKIDSSSLYLGAFGKTEIGNFNFFGGIGYQYTSVNADRSVYNKYDSFNISEKYAINSFNAFMEGKYSYVLGESTKIEPKLKLSYYYVSQDEVDEGYDNKNITMKVVQSDNSTVDVEAGVDFIKTKVLKDGKMKGIVSLGIINTLGDNKKSLTGSIKGMNKEGSTFEIQGVELPKTSGKIGINLEYEKEKGMIYTAGANFEFAKDYNRKVSLQIGVGYRF